MQTFRATTASGAAPATGEPKDRLVLHTRVVSGAGGGPDKTILNSPRFLVTDGYPMLCAYLRPPGDPLFEILERRAETWQAPLVAIDDRGPLDRGVWRHLDTLCDEVQPVIWHGHDYKSNTLGCLLRRRHRFALVTTVHGWVKRTWKTPLYYAIDRATLRRHDHVICVSDDLVETCLALGVPEARCTLVPNAIDSDHYRPRQSKADARRALGFGAEDRVIGAVGRLSAEKDFETLIEAFAALPATTGEDGDGGALRLGIAGEGSELEALAAKARSLGVADRVALLGFVADPRDLYEACDLYAMSSLREGLPNVLLEAMAEEVPIVSTRVAGIPKLIDDGRTGLLVPPGNPDALREALATLLGDPDKASALAAAARREVEVRHSFRIRMQRIKGTYDATLDRLGRRSRAP